MSETITGRVEEVNLVGPKTVASGKNAGKSFFIHEIKLNGQKYSQFDFRQQPVPSALAGDNVNIVYTETTSSGKDGKTFTNRSINSIEVLGSSVVSTQSGSVQPALEPHIASTAAPQTVSTHTKSSTVSQDTKHPVSKDTSMEVSGLLQALIHNQGLSAGTEEALREALRLKRKIASELETNGSV